MTDPATAALLRVLRPDAALTAAEVAHAARLPVAAARAGLDALAAAGTVLVQAQGPHRYHRLASGAATGAPARRFPHPAAFRACRLCYGHLAGEVGVALAGALAARGWIAPAPEGWTLTDSGAPALAGLGVDLAAARRAPRLAPACMDWSERQPHLGGGLGRAIAVAARARGWLVALPPLRDGDTLAHRRVAPTPALREAYGLG